MGADAYLIDAADQIMPQWLESKQNIGVTAGASAPEILVQQVVAYLKDNYRAVLAGEIQTRPENGVFSLPKELKRPAAN
jgi:4-hydroxy-3-methylbut-2-enyl diphosphate reductase